MIQLLVKGAVLGVLLYVGMTLGVPYYQYVKMHRAAEEAAGTGATELHTLRKGLLREEAVLKEVTHTVTEFMQARAIRLGLDLPAKGVQVVLEPDLLRVRTNWEVEARLPGYSQRYRFRVEGRRFLAQ